MFLQTTSARARTNTSTRWPLGTLRRPRCVGRETDANAGPALRGGARKPSATTDSNSSILRRSCWAPRAESVTSPARTPLPARTVSAQFAPAQTPTAPNGTASPSTPQLQIKGAGEAPLARARSAPPCLARSQAGSPDLAQPLPARPRAQSPPPGPLSPRPRGKMTLFL